MIEAIRDGRQELFRQLVDRYLPVVLAFLRSMGATAIQAEDTAQEAFIKAFLNLSRYVPVRPFSAWLLTIARNCFIDARRKKGLDGLPLREEEEERKPGPEVQVVGKLAFEEILAQCSQAEKVLIELRVNQHVPFSDIAELMGEPEGNIRVRFHRLMQRLREKAGKDEI